MNTTIDHMRLEKRAIFEASLKLLREGKFHATPMEEIAFLSNISGTLIFYVFENRQKLLAELSETIIHQIEKELDVAQKNSVGFKERFFNYWMTLYNFYTKSPDVISFVEQFENVKQIPGVSTLNHPGNAKLLIDLFKRTDCDVSAPPETLAYLLHESALSAAKMSAITPLRAIQNNPQKLAEIFWNGLYCTAKTN